MALRPYYAWRFPMDLSRFRPEMTQRQRPRVVHAPSSRAFKGTRYILDAVDKLRDEGLGFDFELIENLSNPEALGKYAESDIIISQVMCPSGGRLAFEGLALGKVVLSRMGFDVGYDEKFPRPCPIIDVSPQNIYQRLKDTIQDLPFREKKATEGPAYMQTYFSSDKVVARILHLLDNPATAPDFHPDFFKDHFIPEDAAFAAVYNKWNRFVKNADWYGKHVGSFERDGLIF